MKIYKNAIELCNDYDGTLYGLGRSLYKNVACGPWVSLVLTEDRTVYYENRAANDPGLLTDPDIIGIKIGSIVEGSDVEIGPEFLKFPISKEDFWKTVEGVNGHFFVDVGEFKSIFEP